MASNKTARRVLPWLALLAPELISSCGILSQITSQAPAVLSATETSSSGGFKISSLSIGAQSTPSWRNFAIPPQSGQFILEFDSTPNGNNITAYTSLSSGAASLSNWPITIRFNSSGTIDALSKSGFSSATTVSYMAGTTYHFRVLVDVPAQIYGVIVTTGTGVPRILAGQYAFASSAMKLDNLGVEASSGSHSIFQVRLSLPVNTAPAPAPAPGAASANGTTVPPATQIVDGSGNIYTVVNGQIAQNGVVDTGTAMVTLLLYYNNLIYQEATGQNLWWSTDGSGWPNSSWTQVSGDPRSAGSITPAPAPVPPPVPLPVPAPTTPGGQPAGKFSRVFIVVLENTDYAGALAQPNLASFARSGALLTNFSAVSHPSEPNYIAMTSGTTDGISDDSLRTVNLTNIADLIEAKGLSWKAYAEAYPGNCSRGDSGAFADRHVPFLSFQDINSNRARCNAHIVNASQLQADVQNGTLPNYSFYTPDVNNDGHNTGVAFADNWFQNAIVPLLSQPNFINQTLVVVTFDEDDGGGGNQIFTALYGSMVVPGSVSSVGYDHYSLLKTVENNFGLGNLGRSDAGATAITGVWK